MVLSEQVIGNILELNIPVLIGSTASTSEPVKCVRCGDSIPPGQVNAIAITSDLDPSTRKGYIGWPVCDNCHDDLIKRAISLKVSTPEYPHHHFQWLEFLRVTLGVCLTKDHSTYDGVDPDKLPSCPICNSPVEFELGHLVLGISYKGLPGRNFGVGESAWTMMHWDCSKKLLEINAKISLEYLKFFNEAMKREYSSSSSKSGIADTEVKQV
jgi:hypothetical protein